MKITRRGLMALMPAAALAQPPAGGPPSKLRTRTSKQIASSPISIGFETLDRKMFDPERTYEHLAKLGVKWARCQTGWARTEMKKGEYDFAWLDSVVDSLLGIGIQPWFNLGYGNTLYTPGPPHESAVGWAPMNSDEARQGWVRYVGRIGERYAGRVKHWEIWNEPNIANFWQPDKPNPKGYVDLVKLTAPVLRKAVPGCTLIGGAFAGMNAWDYFEGCFAEGLAGLVDKISYHPYRQVPEDNYESDLAALRGIVARHRPGMPLWQGENGAPSTNYSTGALRDFEWDEARQAKWLLRRLLTDLTLGVELTSYFQTVDMVNYVWNTGQSGMTNTKGVLRGNVYTPKASYYALQNLCALYDGEARRTDLLLRVEGGAGEWERQAVRKSCFVRAAFPLYAYWYPAILQQGWPTKLARLTLWSGPGARLEKPVLVDLLTGDITIPTKVTRNGGVVILDNMPVRDYPLVVTDAAAVSA
jgi:hypothetical protein